MCNNICATPLTIGRILFRLWFFAASFQSTTTTASAPISSFWLGETNKIKSFVDWIVRKRCIPTTSGKCQAERWSTKNHGPVSTKSTVHQTLSTILRKIWVYGSRPPVFQVQQRSTTTMMISVGSPLCWTFWPWWPLRRRLQPGKPCPTTIPFHPWTVLDGSAEDYSERRVGRFGVKGTSK